MVVVLCEENRRWARTWIQTAILKQEFNLKMNLAYTNIPERSKGSDLRSDASASRVRIPLLVHNPGQTVSTALTGLVSIPAGLRGARYGSTVREHGNGVVV